ncbi:MAG: DUF302 domain-containing protein, partial [Thermoplasmatales archaeon]
CTSSPSLFMLFVEREFDGIFEDIIEGLLFHLKDGGYVIVADVDIKSIMKKALNFEFKNYHIYEICRPQAAKELIGGDDVNGLFLPCKMVAYEDGSKIRVRLVRSSEIAKKFGIVGSISIKRYEDELVGLLNSFST